VILEYFHVHVSSALSLAIICGLLAAGTIASMVHNRRAAADVMGSPNKAVEDAV